ncbi:MAG: hypothetical protein EP330_15720 [Deltaproteobacteria bacterium]|nr:MAG: hypothetical protein EP330_15720 [Deltaproteobacteria bacterium]
MTSMIAQGLTGLALLVLPLTATAGTVETLADGTKFELVKAGKGKKEVLRYTPVVGADETLELRTDVEMSMSLGGMSMPNMPIPTSVLPMDVHVDAIDGDGVIRYSYVIREPRIEAAPGTLPDVAAAAAQSLAGVAGSKGRGTMSPRGESLGEVLELSEAASP